MAFGVCELARRTAKGFAVAFKTKLLRKGAPTVRARVFTNQRRFSDEGRRRSPAMSQKHDCCCGLLSYNYEPLLDVQEESSVEEILHRLRTRLRHSMVQCDQYETQLRESVNDRQAARSLVAATKIKNRTDSLLRLVEEAVRTYEAAHEMQQTARTLSDIMSAIPQDALDELRDVSERVQDVTIALQQIHPPEEEEESSFELPSVPTKSIVKHEVSIINVAE